MQDLKLVRIFFALPEPISIDDGHQVVKVVSSDQGTADDDPYVSLIFHQISVRQSRAGAAISALTTATDRADGIESPKNARSMPEVESPWTVVEAVTTAESPDEIPESSAGSPAMWTPRQDPFARCLATARDVVRAYRHAAEALCALPTYARAISPVLTYSADGVLEQLATDQGPALIMRPVGPWIGPAVLLLDHANLADPYPAEFNERRRVRFNHWWNEIAQPSPLHLWRERWIEARRAHHVEGAEAQAILLANISVEVLLDAVLAVLLWEEGVDVIDAAPIFEEGKVLRRITKELAPRLGGNWSTSSGAVGDWHRTTYAIRHRVVHAGYSPSVGEGAAALAATADVHRFVMDRVAERRTRFPRTALMTVAQEGLVKRGMWTGQIVEFARNVGPTEPSWRASFADYYEALLAALAP